MFAKNILRQQPNSNCSYVKIALIFIVTFISGALKVRSSWMEGGTRFASPRNVFPRLDSVSVHLSGYTTAARSVLPFVTAVAQDGFLALVNKFFALNAQSYHFSSSSNERMTN